MKKVKLSSISNIKIPDRFRVNNLSPETEIDTGYTGSTGMLILHNITRGRTGMFSLHPFVSQSLQVMISDGGGTMSIDPSNADGKILVYRKEDYGNIFIKNNETTNQTLVLIRIGV